MVRNAFAKKARYKWQPVTYTLAGVGDRLKPTLTPMGVGFGVWCCKIMRAKLKLLRP